MLRICGTVVVGEVERDVICDLHNEKRTKRRRVGQAEHLRQECCRLLLVPYADNRVVQLHSHAVDATGCELDSQCVFSKTGP